MSDEELKGFINETRMIGLHHPHIMPLLDFGISRKGLPFLVMEYAPEGTLRDHHPKGERITLPLMVSYVYGFSAQNGMLYIEAFGSNDARGKVYAIDTKTGGEIWSFLTDDNNAYELSVQNGVLYAISAGEAKKVYAIDAKSGQQKWVFSLPEPVHGSVAVQSGILYVGAIPSDTMGKSKIYAIDVQTGHEIWSSPTGGNLFSLSTTANGELYAASSDGIVYAWTLPAPPSRASK